MLLTPFEPRAAVFTAGGLRTTLLELVAAAATLVLLATGRDQVLRWCRHLPVALGFLAALASVHVVSAALAPAHRDLALKFSLRLVAAFLFAVAVAGAPVRARRWALAALAVSSIVVAALAVGEGLGLARLDPWLDLFRDRAFTAGAGRRATAGAGGPNQAAALLAAGLVGGASLLGRTALVVPFASAVAMGLLFTYSRGGLAAAIAGLLVLAWARRGEGARPAQVACGTLGVVALAFLTQQGFRERVQTELTAMTYGARYRPLDASVRLAPGERRALSIDLVNTGAREWTPAELVTINAFLFEWPSRRPAAVWRQPLPRAVATGATERVTLEIQAPARRGAYVLAWDLFTLPSAYLSTSRLAPALVPIGVGVPPPEEVTLPDHVWRRGRLELWRLAIAMWRARPLLGAGPDNFRRLHPQYGGWLMKGFHPMTAHNQFLETAANTGTLGLLALVGTLVFAARAALRGRRTEGAVCLALLAAFVVQAQVDALLEFTGCYLLFAFVVGTSAGIETSTDGKGDGRLGQPEEAS